MIDYSKMAFAKPPKSRKAKPSRVWYLPDGTIDRIVLSESDWKKLREFVWESNIQIYGLVRCHLGAEVIQHKEAMDLDHYKSPRGNGGCYRDDRYVKPACRIHNTEKGSRRDW